jgi:hypothetical protein
MPQQTQSNKILWWLLASVLRIQQMTLDWRLAVIEGKLDILLLRTPRK